MSKVYESHPIVKKALDPSSHKIFFGCIGIHGKMYDMSAFRDIHPGGKEWIIACEGTDATALVETMHLNHAAFQARLASIPCVGTYEQKVRWDFASYRTLKEAILPSFPTRASRQHNITELRFEIWATMGIASHVWMLRTQSYSYEWLISLLASSCCNVVLGGFGHNYLHCLHWRSLALDWNGLSSFEWMLEHVMSHHCYPNSSYDHDSISMLPFVDWNKSQWTNLLILPIFCIGEMAVAAQGYLGHRCRWRPFRDSDFPLWIRLAPFLFLFRIASHFAFQPFRVALSTLFLTLVIASFYFSYLAHVNHASQADDFKDFLNHQLQSTKDIKSFPKLFNDLLLGLDRQTLHHLFPTIDHSLLNQELRTKAYTLTNHESFIPLRLLKLNRVMWNRLLGMQEQKKVYVD